MSVTMVSAPARWVVLLTYGDGSAPRTIESCDNLAAAQEYAEAFALGCAYIMPSGPPATDVLQVSGDNLYDAWLLQRPGLPYASVTVARVTETGFELGPHPI